MLVVVQAEVVVPVEVAVLPVIAQQVNQAVQVVAVVLAEQDLLEHLVIVVAVVQAEAAVPAEVAAQMVVVV